MIGLYPRVSTLEQAEHGHSIDEQIERMEKYCEAMGWTVYKVYTDAGYSGGNMERPGLQMMIRDIKKGRIDKVLVYKLDRLSRSQKDTLELIEDIFLANKVDFVSMSENFDTSTPFGRAMVGILAVFAQLEREQIKERMSMGRMARAKKGRYIGSQAPIGYDYEDGHLTPNDFEKMLVSQVFEKYVSGASPFTIAAELNEAGLIHKYGNWNRETIRTVIENRVYLGEVQLSGNWYSGQHEPIIEPETFEKAQTVKTRKHEAHRKWNRRLGKANSYLGGYIECSCCHAKYGKISQHRKGNGKVYHYVYYQCNSRSKKDKTLIKDPNCKNKNWTMTEFDNLIFEEIKKLALDPNYIAEITENAPEDERPKAIKKEMKKLDDQISRLMDLYTVGNMPVEILQERIHGLNDQKIKLEQALEKIKKETKQKITQAEAMQIVEDFEDILARNDFEEIREVIGSLIDKIEVDNDNITIYWAFA